MDNLYKLSEELGDKLKTKAYALALAESCTGGLLAEIITRIPGSSAWFDCGVVSYSNQAKTKLLGVSEELLQSYGAVSSEVAIAMAEGILQRSSAQLALSITGIAGPDGGTAEKPVGLVYMGLACKRAASQSQTFHFQGERLSIRAQTAQHALKYLLNFL